jgi:hypothetical protein
MSQDKFNVSKYRIHKNENNCRHNKSFNNKMVLESRLRLTGTVSPDEDKRNSVTEMLQKNEKIISPRNDSPQKKVSRAATRRKAKQLMKEQDEVLRKHEITKLEKTFTYKDPILFGGSNVPTEVQRMTTLSSNLLTTQNPELETYPSAAEIDKVPVNEVKQDDLKQQEWDKAPQPQVKSTSSSPRNRLSPIEAEDIQVQEHPVLIGIDKLAQEGELIHIPNKSESTITDYDADSLPDESSLQDVQPESATDSFSYEPQLRALPEDSSHMKHTSFVPKNMIQQTLLNKNIIPLDTPSYITHVATNLNLEYKGDSLYLEKKTKKAAKLLGLLTKKLNKQLFVFRDNGHIESALNNDLVLSCEAPPGEVSEGTVLPVFMCKKKALMGSQNADINQRWIVQESFSDRRYRYLACARNTRFVLDKDPNGFGLIIRLNNDSNQQMWAFKTYQGL